MSEEMKRETEEYARIWHSGLSMVMNDLNVFWEEDRYDTYLDVIYGDTHNNRVKEL